MNYRPLRPYAVVAAVMAALGVVCEGIDDFSPRPSLAVINDAHASSSERGLAFALTVVGALELIALFAWSWRAAKNVRALGKKGLAFTPFTTVAWWFIPIANLYMPYRAIREAWLASGDDEKPPPTLLIWWILSWVASVVGLAAEGSTPVILVALALSVTQAALFARIALGLASRQARLAATVATATATR